MVGPRSVWLVMVWSRSECGVGQCVVDQGVEEVRVCGRSECGVGQSVW